MKQLVSTTLLLLMTLIAVAQTEQQSAATKTNTQELWIENGSRRIYGELFTPHELQFLDSLGDLLDLLLQQPLLPFFRHGNFLKLAMADDDGIIVTGCNSGTETAAVILFKILLRGNQNLGRWI